MAGSYLYSNKSANQEVEKQMEIIRKTISREIPGVLSIVLTGGYAYGDGGSVVSGRTAVPVNDYDLYVVCKNAPGQEETERVQDLCCKRVQEHIRELIKKESRFPGFAMKELQKLSDTMNIDIRCVTRKAIKGFPPMLRFYDLKQGGRTI